MKKASNTPRELARSIGEAIARERKAAHLTQQDVAEELGVGVEAVSRLERGVVVPTVARLVELATIFNCPVDRLIREGSNRPSEQARQLECFLEQVNAEDRALVLDVFERLCRRFAKN